MLQRLRDSGLNLMVLLVSLLVFLASFGGLSYFAESSRPPRLSVLAAARDLAMGEVIAPGDLVEKSVYQDENSALYIRRVHHEKRWSGRSTSWNQDCREKYQ